jgi:carboxyl-terminal processing protease
MIMNVASRGVRWLAGVLLAAGCLMPRFSGAATSDGGREPDVYELMALFSKTAELIRESYVDEGKTSYDALVRGALRGMLQTLDADSQLVVQDEAGSAGADAGLSGGIGIVVSMTGGVLEVISALDDTPGFRAGLQSGDEIVEIDGKATDDLSLAEAVKKLRGPPGSKVVIKVLRVEGEEILPVELVREKIVIPNVRQGRMLKNGIAYIRIVQFTEPAGQSLKEQVHRLLGEGMKALVLDVRGNAGGLDAAALDMAQDFLKRGAVIVSARGRSSKDQQMWRARGAGAWLGFPMAVLVDRGTAGAGEILASALRDNGRATVVGQRTFGRGSIQSLIPLDKGSSIRLTSALYYTPKGQKIQDQGVVPDVEVEMTREQWQTLAAARTAFTNAVPAEADGLPGVGSDTQLERAMDILQMALSASPRAK